MKLLAFLVATVVSSAVLAQNFGAPPTARPGSDGATFVTFISGHAAPATGTVTEWQFYANNPGFVSLQMWRPGGGGYTLLGRHDLNVTTTGLNVFSPGASGIAVQAGDVMGFATTVTRVGSLASALSLLLGFGHPGRRLGRMCRWVAFWLRVRCRTLARSESIR